jgi:hypothetical protein
MSGFEIAGVVLAVIPIAMTSYGRISEFFRDYRGFERQVKRLQRKHLIQTKIFQRSIRTLLSGSIDEANWSDALKDTNHPQWTDNILKTDLGVLFGENVDTAEEVMANVELIQESLAEILRLCGTIWGIHDIEVSFSAILKDIRRKGLRVRVWVLLLQRLLAWILR